MRRSSSSSAPLARAPGPDPGRGDLARDDGMTAQIRGEEARPASLRGSRSAQHSASKRRGRFRRATAWCRCARARRDHLRQDARHEVRSVTSRSSERGERSGRRRARARARRRQTRPARNPPVRYRRAAAARSACRRGGPASAAARSGHRDQPAQPAGARRLRQHRAEEQREQGPGCHGGAQDPRARHPREAPARRRRARWRDWRPQRGTSVSGSEPPAGSRAAADRRTARSWSRPRPMSRIRRGAGS